jgi:hypothetical protein
MSLQPAAEDSAVNTVSPNLVMVSCLAPFGLAFLSFAIYLAYRTARRNRWIKQLQQITTLERTLEKTPDECP